MSIYKIQGMTTEDYHRYMSGSYVYDVKTFEVEADTKEEAIAKVKSVSTGYILNTGYVKTIEELDVIEQEKERKRLERIAKEEEKKIKAKIKEEEKAKSLGLTVEELRKEKALKAKKTRYKREIENLEKELLEIKKKIEYRKNFLENN